MATLTDVAANAALDAMTSLYVQLHTADPTDTGLVSKSVAYPNRLAAPLAAAATRQRASNAAINFTAAAAAETVTHVSLWDAITAGSCRWRGPLTASVPVALADGLTIASGALVIGLT